VLIHAAASGVGTAALQIARAIGARAIGTTRSRGKLRALAAYGLLDGDGIVPADGKFASEVQARATGGAAVVLDCVGAAYLEENLRALATRGRLVLLGTLGGGGGGAAPVGMILGKRATIIGTVMRARPLEEKIALARTATAYLVPLFERGALAPVVYAEMPMTACAEAHVRMERDENVGKLVLRW
jgi:NADPH2:quinone reductase